MELKTKRACVHCGRKFGLRGVKTHERTCVNAETKASIARGLKQSAKGGTVYKGSFGQYVEDDMERQAADDKAESPSEVEILAHELKAAHDVYQTAYANMEQYIDRLRARY